MTTSRRGFFAAMLAPFMARFIPVPEPKTGAVLLDEINAVTLANLYQSGLEDNFFLTEPFLFSMQDSEPATQPTTLSCNFHKSALKEWTGDN